MYIKRCLQHLNNILKLIKMQTQMAGIAEFAELDITGLDIAGLESLGQLSLASLWGR